MSYTGGKGGSGVYQALVNMMPPHRVYIEAFLGAGSVVRAKKPALVNIGIEKSGLVASSFPAMPALTVINGDAASWLSGYPFAGDELVYCDPPYVRSTRASSRALYEHEMTDGDHVQLLTVLLGLPCMIMVSGYWSSLYADMLAGWRVETFQTVNRAGNVVTEYVWLNFPPPLELHDYQFLGRGFRERERIKRKKLRWKEGLLRMAPLERYAVLSAIAELRNDHNAASGDVGPQASSLGASGDADGQGVGIASSGGVSCCGSFSLSTLAVSNDSGRAVSGDAASLGTASLDEPMSAGMKKQELPKSEH